jgi:hypothetical protein
MAKYLFKGLDAASAPGPGPVLWFPSPRAFSDVVAQISITGGGAGFTVFFNVPIEITVNGTDFRAISTSVAISNSLAPGNNNGAIAHLGPIELMMGIRLNLASLSVDGGDSPTITVLLAIDEKE